MASCSTSLTIPVDQVNSVVSEQAKLSQEIKQNRAECADLQHKMQDILKAAISLVKVPVEDDVISVKSIHSDSDESISLRISGDSVSDDDSVTLVASPPTPPSNNVSSSSASTPNFNSVLDDFLSLSATGQLDLTDEILKQLYVVNTKIDSVNSVAEDLQNKWVELDNMVADIENVKQYLMKESLLLHNSPCPLKTLLVYNILCMWLGKLISSFLNFL